MRSWVRSYLSARVTFLSAIARASAESRSALFLLYSGRSEWSEGPWFGCPWCDFVPYPYVATKLPQRWAARNLSHRGAKKLCVQHLGNFACELVERERLGDQADAGLDGPVMHDGVAGIAGGEQNFDVRAALPHLVR